MMGRSGDGRHARAVAPSTASCAKQLCGSLHVSIGTSSCSLRAMQADGWLADTSAKGVAVLRDAGAGSKVGRCKADRQVGCLIFCPNQKFLSESDCPIFLLGIEITILVTHLLFYLRKIKKID